ncbi:MAG: Kelch repeat type 2-containing protein [Bacteroidetes bacterium]|nr:Kelch repeat type 2-containing protein [Bacteroidota bacterium]
MKRYIPLFMILIAPLYTLAQGGVWTFVKGNYNYGSAISGHTGTIGISNSADYPGPRYSAAQWKDLNGNFWIFGGRDRMGLLHNDLWRYDPSLNLWTWVNGPDSASAWGIYGTQGIPGPNNIPGARGYGVRSWTDQFGRLWLHGGGAYDGISYQGLIDDMWMYDITTNQWAWMKGADTINTPSNYGNLQVAALNNTPGALQECNSAWVKSDGTLWFFGGMGYGHSNNVWKFDINTNHWTWMSGSGEIDSFYSYGNINVESASNRPKARCSYSHWQDDNDNFYIWGGYRFDSISSSYNDVWKYNTGNNYWTWISGDSFLNDTTRYMGLCTPGNGCAPGLMLENRTTQTNGCDGRFWTFGGLGDNFGLWNFDIQTQEWTAFSATNPFTDYRFGCCMWADSAGAIWIWGGDGRSDMWRFVPDHDCIQPHISFQLSDSLLCIGDSSHLLLKGGKLLSLAPAMGSHITDSASIILNPSITTSYTAIGLAFCGVADTFYFTIKISHPPNTSSNQTICSGDSFLFNDHTLSAVGIYYDTLTSISGCDSIIQLTLSTVPRPIAGFSITPIGDSIPYSTINVTNTSSNSDTILWQLNNELVTIVNGRLPISDTGNYCIRLIASSQAGCRDTSQQCIYVFENAFAIPNGFTPNGDGKNDLFYPVFINKNGIAVTSFKIYNRWGQLVYDDPTGGWDGNYKGEPQPGEAYTYFISMSLLDSSHPGQMREIKKEGGFELLR